MLETKDWGEHFQTPPNICNYMASFLPKNAGKILEPTAGKGRLVEALKSYGDVIAPQDFYKLEKQSFDWIVMNPPFTPMSQGYKILYRAKKQLVYISDFCSDDRKEKLIEAINNKLAA